MFFDLFGNYLIEQNKLTSDKLAELKGAQASSRLKLGFIAVSEKMITEKQSDDINRRQALMDKRFGDIAVSLGYLTEEQVGKLLGMQGNAYLKFCQLVTEQGIMTMEDIEAELKNYASANGFSDAQLEDIKSDDIDRIMPLFMPAIDEKFTELIAVGVRTINRIISSNICIGKAYVVDSLDIANYAIQGLTGDFNVRTGFVGTDDSILVIADAYAKESFKRVDDDSLDSVAEVINIINGLYATSLSYQKVNVELQPPLLITESEKVEASQIAVMPITIDGRDVKMFVAID